MKQAGWILCTRRRLPKDITFLPEDKCILINYVVASSSESGGGGGGGGGGGIALHKLFLETDRALL